MSVSAEYPYESTLSPELIEKAEKELNEKAKWRDRDVQALRDMVIAHKGLKCPLDTAFLLRFLRARKFDYEKSYQLLINYYTIRATNAEILKELTPSAIEHLIDSEISCVLPLKDKFNRKILYFRAGKWNPELFPMIEILRMNLINLEKIIKDEANQVNGIVAVGNFADVGMTHVMNIDMNYVRMNIHVVQDAFPMRFKALHFVNEPAVFGYIFSIVKHFLKEKMAKRLKFHGSSLENLHAAFDKKCLPQELGGELPPGDELLKAWKKTLMEDEPMFQEMKKYKIEVPRSVFDNDTASKAVAECIAGPYENIRVDCAD